ncbi:serine hydrolase domain-containing protein [Amycolatopsis nivea]|uniref:serine hydrolase domain-containing protein n=1 Tax=Amycolatopsis nivea TaxID=1644109 RepID=UPI001F0EC42A|nr:serine hydrolase [Amycolatopsis nivea]
MGDRKFLRTMLSCVLTLGFMNALAAAPSAAATGSTAKPCALPSSGGFESASPAQEALDPAAVRKAVAYAATHLRLSVQVFRNNCRVGTGPLDPITEEVPWNVWSSTKSVVSMLTGIAIGQGRLGLDDPIGKHLPTGAGWGDAAHRAITVRQLLDESSGLKQSIFAETATAGTDENVAQEALAQPLTHRPGTRFAYGQRDPDLLAYVVQRAVGEDLQEFAQRNLFAPIGIPRSSYFWLRDRAGNTYGYAFLFIPPLQYAKLGLLMQNDGAWNGHQVVPADYVHHAGKPSSTNGCYGFLFWTNAGTPCASGPEVTTRTMLPSAPRDTYLMIGAFHQNNFVIPSLKMTVSWTGFLGDTTPDIGGLTSGSPNVSDLYYTFFRILMRGVRDKQVPDPGPYTLPSTTFDPDGANDLDPSVLLTDALPNSTCNLLFCDGTIPQRGAALNAESVIRTVLTLARRQ